MGLLDRFRAWRRRRLEQRLCKSAVLAVLSLAEQRLGRELTQDENSMLAWRFAKWMEDEPSRVTHLLDAPTRTLQLFLSEVL